MSLIDPTLAGHGTGSLIGVSGVGPGDPGAGPHIPVESDNPGGPI